MVKCESCGGENAYDPTGDGRWICYYCEKEEKEIVEKATDAGLDVMRGD